MSSKPARDIDILAKYLFWVKYEEENKQADEEDTAYDITNIYREIDSFLKKAVMNYNGFKWSDTIRKHILYATVRKPIQIKDINIYQEELNKIKELNNQALEKLAFTLLCLAKFTREEDIQRFVTTKGFKTSKNNVIVIRETENEFHDNDGWVRNTLGEIFSYANINVDNIKKNMYLKTLYEKKLIRFPVVITNENIKVNYMLDEFDKSNSNKKIAMTITRFDQFGYQYVNHVSETKVYHECQYPDCHTLFRQNKRGDRKFCNAHTGYVASDKKTIVCEDCNEKIIIDSWDMKTKRCKVCQQIVDKEKNKIASRERMKKYRNRNVTVKL